MAGQVKYKSGDVPLPGDIIMCVDDREGKRELPFLLMDRGVYVVSTVESSGVWVRPRASRSGRRVSSAVLSPRRFRLLSRKVAGDAATHNGR